MKVLFLCTANLNRSRTAEVYFNERYPGHQFRSAGMSEKYCKKHNTNLCTTESLQWADQVLVMEQAHLERIIHYTGQDFVPKITVLDIPDTYQYMQPELIFSLEKKVFLILQNC